MLTGLNILATMQKDRTLENTDICSLRKVVEEMDSLKDLAFIIAEDAHFGQEDKLGNPYIAHPVGVSELLQLSPAYEMLSEEDQEKAVVVALLHDVLEDCEYYDAEDLIEAGIPEDIVEIVEILTYSPSFETRAEYYERILENEIAHAVKIADLAHNNLPSRVGLLDDMTQKRLATKYDLTKKVLLREGDMIWFTNITRKDI